MLHYFKTHNSLLFSYATQQSDSAESMASTTDQTVNSIFFQPRCKTIYLYIKITIEVQLALYFKCLEFNSKKS